MREVGVLEAKTKLSALLDEVEGGGEVVITRHGRPVARMVGADAPSWPPRRPTGEELVVKAKAFQQRLIDQGFDPKPESWEDLKELARR